MDACDVLGPARAQILGAGQDPHAHLFCPVLVATFAGSPRAVRREVVVVAGPNGAEVGAPLVRGCLNAA